MPEFGFDCLSIPDLYRYSLVCRSAAADVKRYVGSGSFLYRGLHRWFTRRECEGLRAFLASTGGLLSGSAILSMFVGESWLGPMSLRLHVPHVQFPEVTTYLRSHGYGLLDPVLTKTPWSNFEGMSRSNTFRIFHRSSGRTTDPLMVGAQLLVIRCLDDPPFRSVLECASGALFFFSMGAFLIFGFAVPTMNFLSSGRICCMARDWICSRTVPHERDLLRAPDNPTAVLRGLGWRLQPAKRAIHYGRRGGPRQIFDSLCSTYCFASGPRDELDGFRHRWADLVLVGGRYRAEVYSRSGEPELCRDPYFLFEDDFLANA